jgi:hypothetical protein
MQKHSLRYTKEDSRRPKVEFRLSRYGDGTLTVWGKPQVKVEEKKASKVAKVDKSQPGKPFEPDFSKMPLDTMKVETTVLRESGKTGKGKISAKEALDENTKDLEKLRKILDCI